MTIGATTSRRLVAWKVNLLDPDLASVRYRCLYPAHALNEAGLRSGVFERDWNPSDYSGIRALVLVKTFEDRDVRLVRGAKRAGVPIICDLCDNIFVPAYGGPRHDLIEQNFLEMARLSDVVTTSTEALADVIRGQLCSPVPIIVIPDSVETRELLCLYFDCHNPSANREYFNSLEKSEKTVVWFGNAGSSHGKYGITVLKRITPAIAAIAKDTNIRLVVVSNDRNMFEGLIASAVPAEYVEWDALGCLEVVARSDVCLLPNSRDPFSWVKSANRAILSLSLGTPVVATLIPSLEPLKNCIFTDDFEIGIRTYLSDSQRCREDLSRARTVLDREYSLNVIGAAWIKLFEALARMGGG